MATNSSGASAGDAGSSTRPGRETDKTDDDSRPPCRYFMLGRCRFGDSCSFGHQTGPSRRRPVCKYYTGEPGSCKYGDSCVFLHQEAEAQAEPGQEAEPEGGGPGQECGICLDSVVGNGKRFALLTGCDHVYCIPCIRKWRASSEVEKEVSRACPVCRKTSFFVMPSKVHLRGEAKHRAIREYKELLATRPCRDHAADGTMVCRFGQKCLYAHLDADGRDMKHLQRQPLPRERPRPVCPFLLEREREAREADQQDMARRVFIAAAAAGSHHRRPHAAAHHGAGVAYSEEDEEQELVDWHLAEMLREAVVLNAAGLDVELDLGIGGGAGNAGEDTFSYVLRFRETGPVFLTNALIEGSRR